MDCLWCHVAWRTDVVIVLLSQFIYFACEPEVPNFELSFSVEKEISRLEVSVNNSLLMKIPVTFNDLPHVFPSP